MNARTIVPLLGVKDPERSVAFYRDALGFSVDGDNYCDKQLTWAHLSHGCAQLMITGPMSELTNNKTAPAVLKCVMLYMYVDDVRAFRDECVANNLDVSEPAQRFYGLLEVELQDPDGYTIIAGEHSGIESKP